MSSNIITGPSSSSPINYEDNPPFPYSYLVSLAEHISCKFIDKGYHCEYIIHKNTNGFSQIILILDGLTYVHTGYTTQIENSNIVAYRLWEYIPLTDIPLNTSD